MCGFDPTGESPELQLRHCEEHLRRSNPAFLSPHESWIASPEPVIGRAFAGLTQSSSPLPAA
jgi:hypothetical protein